MKTATFSAASSTPATIVIDYNVVVRNEKFAKPAYHAVMTDTLYDPWNRLESTRSWKLGTLEPGDQITLTYSLGFDTRKTKPGTYRNVARITGQRNETTYAPQISKMPATEAWGDVTFAEGIVLGAATAAAVAVAPVPTPVACVPLITENLRRGSADTAEVSKLQVFLNRELGLSLPPAGFFGALTERAVSTFQEKYASEVLAPVGLTRGTGNVYASTRAKINALSCGGSMPLSTETPVSTDVAVQAAAASVPAPAPKAPAKPKAVKKEVEKKEAEKKSGNSLGNVLGGWFSRFGPK